MLTTRPQGKGSGIGLAAVVRHHAGDVSVTSTLGVGATFNLHLPLADAFCIRGARYIEAGEDSPGRIGNR